MKKTTLRIGAREVPVTIVYPDDDLDFPLTIAPSRPARLSRKDKARLLARLRTRLLAQESSNAP